MIDHKTAIQKAMTYIADLLPEAKDFVLEEISKSPDQKFWMVTLGFKPNLETDPLQGIFSKKYKQIIISADSGDFSEMRSRISG